MTRVLFVCMGNICRSPMAEGAFRQHAAAAGLPLDRPGGIITDSAGTSAFHVGSPPDPRAIRAAAARGIDISMQRARRAVPEDFARFDHIVAMDRDNLAILERMAGADPTRLSLLLSHAPAIRLDEVPDPYYGGDAGFDRCLDLIETATRALFEAIRA